jgi:penicillin amidase
VAFDVRETVQVETENLLALLIAPDHRLGSDPVAARDRLLTETLSTAWQDVTDHFGSDPTGWTWGSLHTMTFRHALDSRWNIGPVAKAGSGLTVASADYRRPGFAMALGASFRMVLDVGDWDRSMAINAPGQSGDPRSPHYADLVARWGDDRYFPLVFSPERVRLETTNTIRLEPAK